MNDVHKTFIFVIFSPINLLALYVVATCPRGLTLYHGLCLTLPNQTMLMSWPNALGTCQDLGGTLLTIDNAQKQKNIEEFIADHYNVSRIDMDLQPVYEYHFMDGLDKFIRNEKYIQFDFKGCNDAYVILSEHRNSSFRSYEVLFGGWKNTLSVIRKCRQCAPMTTTSHSPLSCTEFKPFWISWENGTIRAGEGREVGASTFMEWSDSTSHPVNFFGISSWRTAQTSWRFLKDPYNSTFWLAGSDLGHHAQWEWFPKEDFVGFTNWLPGLEESQKRSPSRHCMQMSLHNDFKWAADNCMQNRNFICEISKHESSTKAPFGRGVG